MATKGFIVYLLSTFSVAVMSVLFISNHQNHPYESKPHLSSPNSTLLQNPYGSESMVWPDLRYSWRVVLATVIGFLGSAFGTVGGVGGGGIFVPMLTLIIGFDTKSAAALSKCMIMGASASSVWYNLRVHHPCREVPIIDYDLALLFQPMLMLGITVGVSLSVVFPYWLITVLIIIMFLGTSSRSVVKAIEMWKEETKFKKAMVRQQETAVNSHSEQLLIDVEYAPLVPMEEKTTMRILRLNLRWKRILLLVTVWVSFLLLQVLKNDLVVCVVLGLLQLPIALVIFGYESVKLYKESEKRRSLGNTQNQLVRLTLDRLH